MFNKLEKNYLKDITILTVEKVNYYLGQILVITYADEKMEDEINKKTFSKGNPTLFVLGWIGGGFCSQNTWRERVLEICFSI